MDEPYSSTYYPPYTATPSSPNLRGLPTAAAIGIATVGVSSCTICFPAAAGRSGNLLYPVQAVHRMHGRQNAVPPLSAYASGCFVSKVQSLPEHTLLRARLSKCRKIKITGSCVSRPASAAQNPKLLMGG